MKLILALHQADAGTVLLDSGFRAALAAAGATRLQVNVDDHAVAPAMRFGPGPRITAVVSAWTTGDPAAVVAAVREVDGTADGWLIQERTPLPPPEVRRRGGDALANTGDVRLRPEPGPRGAHQAGPEVAGIVEELFPMAAMSDSHAFYGSGGDEAELQRRFAALMESCARSGADQGPDLVPTSRYAFGL